MGDKMKNYISYYYNIKIDEITFRNNKYYLNSNGELYVFELCKNVYLNQYYHILKSLLFDNKYFLTIKENKDNSIITLINNAPYILIKTKKHYDEKISVFDIKSDYYVDFERIKAFDNILRFPWNGYWQKKIDYFENLILSRQEKYKNIHSILQYFIGLSENALLYFNVTLNEIGNNIKFLNLVIQHNRLTYDSTLYDYYNPNNIIIDHKSRDICEYIKSGIQKNVDFNESILEKYIRINKFSVNDIKIMYSRLCFPTSFFDLFEETLEDNTKKFDNLEEYLINYSKLLKKITHFLTKKFGITPIEWIIKKI